MTDFEQARTAMVDCQVRPSDVTQYALIEAMLRTPRERFVPRARASVAYADTDIVLGHGRVLLAARTFAKMLEAASIGKDDLVLDLAPGLGYSTAVLSRLAQAVVAIEPVEALRTAAVAALDAVEADNAVVSDGDVLAGDPAHGPFDAILINGAVEAVPPALIDQLKDGGRMIVIRQSGELQQCRALIRAGDAVADRYLFDASAPRLTEFDTAEVFSF